MIRALAVASIIALASNTASAADWSLYGGARYSGGAGRIHRNTSSYTATPHPSGSIQPPPPGPYATAEGRFESFGPQVFFGGRYGAFIADMSLGVEIDVPHESRLELMAGVQPPIGWPIRFESKYFKVIPSLVVGGGAGGVQLYEPNYCIVRRGPYASAALRVDVRISKVLLRIGGQYRAMFTKSQEYIDLTDPPSIGYDFAKAGFSWDLGFHAGLGLEF